jgi:elongation factor Ts
MVVEANLIKDLREKTGAGIVDCKKALEKTDGNLDKAIVFLREQGILKAQKITTRIAKEGLVSAYIHGDGKIGVLVEVNCETDFVSKTQDFRDLVKNISLQIAAANPTYISINDISEDFKNAERDIFKNQTKLEGKPEKIIDNIVEGKLKKRFEEVCLLEQPFVKDMNRKIKDILTDYIAKLGENIVIRRFSRFTRGEEIK